MTTAIDRATGQAWAALGGAPELLERVSYQGQGDTLPSRLPVRELARATVGVCSLAAAELQARRRRGPVPAVRVDEDAVATAFVSERHLRIDGRAPATFAPLSGFWRSADGWVRTHANYPHHRARLLAALGIADGPGGEPGADALAERLSAELATRPAQQIQETAYAAGALAVAVAPPGGGVVHPLLVSRTLGAPSAGVLAPAVLPAAGVRVLDLTRVIAGPVATRTLALLGADVLRIDPPRFPEAEDAHADTGFGKRSAQLDLGGPAGRATLEDLLATADVVITGYRPGALDRWGLSPDALSERRPGLIVAQLCAWGWSGRWAERRGFDSLVQAACGVASIEAGPDGRPGVLPAQALDHGTGYLLAAAVLRALSNRQESGEGRHLQLSLAGTADWLMHGIAPTLSPAAVPSPAPAATRSPAPGPVTQEPGAAGSADHRAGRWLTERDSAYGRLRYARSPIGYEGAPADWAAAPSRWGTDRAVWS